MSKYNNQVSPLIALILNKKLLVAVTKLKSANETLVIPFKDIDFKDIGILKVELLQQTRDYILSELSRELSFEKFGENNSIHFRLTPFEIIRKLNIKAIEQKLVRDYIYNSKEKHILVCNGNVLIGEVFHVDECQIERAVQIVKTLINVQPFVIGDFNVLNDLFWFKFERESMN